MANNEESEAQYVIEEDDEHFDPLLDDVDMATLIEKDRDSESESQNGLRGVDVKGQILSSHEKEGAMSKRDRRARPGTLGEAHSSGYSRH